MYNWEIDEKDAFFLCFICVLYMKQAFFFFLIILTGAISKTVKESKLVSILLLTSSVELIDSRNRAQIILKLLFSAKKVTSMCIYP